MPQRPIISDEYTAPLGLDQPARSRRRIVFWPLALGLAAALLIGVGGWTLIVRDPYGGEPMATADLPALPAKPISAATSAVVKPAAPDRPDDPSGQIIIRDP